MPPPATIVRANKLHTVCEEAACPNIGECWTKRHATMMIMGDTCTRACAFCNVKTGLPARWMPRSRPMSPARSSSGLAHVVITSVDRDDLADGGAQHFAEVIRAIHAHSPGTSVEVLTPDFLRKDGAIEIVMAAQARSLQPQSGNRAAAVSDHPAGRALFRVAAAAGAGQGTDAARLHQIGADGGPGRRAAKRSCR